jgi:hypothetical protein
MVEVDRVHDNIIRRVRIACWITKAIYSHSEYVILLVFPLQQCLRERSLVLRYTYIAYLVIFLTNGFDPRPCGLSGTQPDTRTGFPQSISGFPLSSLHSFARLSLKL